MTCLREDKKKQDADWSNSIRTWSELFNDCQGPHLRHPGPHHRHPAGADGGRWLVGSAGATTARQPKMETPGATDHADL